MCVPELCLRYADGSPCATSGEHAAGAGAGRAALPVRYQFHEGYTNAVKRPVRMRDLL